MVSFKSHTTESHVLTSEGLLIAQNGSHEYLVWNALEVGVILSPKELEIKVGKEVAKIGQGKAMRNKWIGKKGDGFERVVSLRYLFSGPRRKKEGRGRENVECIILC